MLNGWRRATATSATGRLKTIRSMTAPVFTWLVCVLLFDSDFLTISTELPNVLRTCFNRGLFAMCTSRTYYKGNIGVNPLASS